MRGGEVFVTKMPFVNVMDLGVAIWEIINGEGSRSTLKFHEIGVKPGEKLFEELMTSEELRRTIELKDYFCVLPAFRGFLSRKPFHAGRCAIRQCYKSLQFCRGGEHVRCGDKGFLTSTR